MNLSDIHSRRRNLLVALLLCLSLVACGGGSSGAGGGDSGGDDAGNDTGNDNGNDDTGNDDDGNDDTDTGNDDDGGTGTPGPSDTFTAAGVTAGGQPKEAVFNWTFDGTADHYVLEVNPDGASGYTPVDINGDGTVDANDAIAGDANEIALTLPLHLTDFNGAQYNVVAYDAAGDALDRTDPVSLTALAVELVGYFKASNPDASDTLGWSIALSRDGSTMAVGSFQEDSAATGVDGDETDNTASSAGAVYVFHRTGGAWSQEAYIKPSSIDANDQFGLSLALSDDGNLLAVSARDEDSAAAGIDGDAEDDTLANSGAVHVFARADGSWTQQAYIKASNPGGADEFGHHLALSGDGTTLAVGAPSEESNATGIDGNQADDSLSNAGAVYVFVNIAGSWSQQAYVKASNTGGGDSFGLRVALADDGNTLAVTAHHERSAADGVNGDQADNTANEAGAAYVFVRDTGNTWTQQAYVKASNSEAGDQFGSALALSGNGNTLVVGAHQEGSAATEINGDQIDNSAAHAGAAYVFERSGATWSQQAYLKAPNAKTVQWLGSALALSEDGNACAISARGEYSGAIGVGGDMNDASVAGAGAVHVFTRAGGTWSYGSYIKAKRAAVNNVFGSAVALSGDGRTLAASAPGEDGGIPGINGDHTDESKVDAGAVYVY